ILSVIGGMRRTHQGCANLPEQVADGIGHLGPVINYGNLAVRHGKSWRIGGYDIQRYIWKLSSEVAEHRHCQLLQKRWRKMNLQRPVGRRCGSANIVQNSFEYVEGFADGRQKNRPGLGEAYPERLTDEKFGPEKFLQSCHVATHGAL